jgi:hypothetical protein
MARTLSDALIIAAIEAATRLTGARGPIAGSAAANAQTSGAVATPPAGEGAATGATATPEAAPSAKSGGDGGSGGAGGPGGGEHDTRTATEIATDFKTIYTEIETLVRGSAEQETKAVGFSR